MFIEAQHSDLLPVYDAFSYAIQRVDVLKYLVLNFLGGMYVDIDVECLRPIDGLLEGYEAVVVHEPPSRAIARIGRGSLSNAFIGASPEHPLTSEVLRRLAGASRPALTHGDVLESTGPAMFDRAFRAGDYAGTAVLEPRLVFPFAGGARELRVLRENGAEALSLRRSLAAAGTFAIHY
jgi:inositol phosphorylceramide mannosyltransferase catalytic subunit